MSSKGVAAVGSQVTSFFYVQTRFEGSAQEMHLKPTANIDIVKVVREVEEVA